MKTAYEIIDEHDLIGVPFEWCARDPKVALDCYGLVKFIHNEQGRQVPEYNTPTEPRESKAFIQAMSGQRKFWKKTDSIDEGMVIIFRTLHYLHVGYSLGDGRFVHTWEASGGVTIEPISDWKSRIEGIYEFIGS